MSIHISCPQCQKRLNVADSAAGKKVKCPGCSRVFVAEESYADADALPPLPPDEPAPRRMAAKSPASRARCAGKASHENVG